MQFVKTLLIVAVLAAVTYGVYAALTGKSDVAPPPGAPPPEQTSGAPQIELPNFDAQTSSGIPGVGGIPGAPAADTGAPITPPAQPSALGEAPRYATPPAGADSGVAPPFESPNVGPGEAAPATTGAPAYDPGPAAAIPAAPGAPIDPTTGAGLPPVGLPPAATPDPGAPPGGAPPVAAAPTSNYQTDCATAQAMLQQHQLDQALLLMSAWYGSPTLSEADQTALLGLLNQLAGTVIYSRENWLAEAYEIQAGDTLDQIATRYNVPPQLLAKINALPDPNHLQPGVKLKVVKGPFDAVVDMKNRYLILKLQGRFAGRFPIAAGAEPAATDGEYQVKDKRTDPIYYSRDRAIAAGDPANPLGKYWIDLGGGIAIHGATDPESLNRNDPRGCLRMHPRDVEDVYDMVTKDSRVTILR